MTLYVAKEADAAASNLPPGWQGGWQFVGPWPPGYTPVLTYTLTGASTYAPGANYEPTVTLYDQDSYETNAPDNAITLTASIGGSPIQLKFSGDASYSWDLSLDHSDLGAGFYGGAPTLLFSVDESYDGETIVLKAESTPFDAFSTQHVEKTLNITVVVTRVYTATASVVVSPVTALPEQDPGNSALYGYRLTFKQSDGDPLAYAWCTINRWNGEPEYSYATLDSSDEEHFLISSTVEDEVGFDELYWLDEVWFDEQLNDYAATITALQLVVDETYQVYHRHEPTCVNSPNAISDRVYNYTFKLYLNGELDSTITKTVTKNWNDPLDTDTEWVRLTWSDGVCTATEITP